VRHRATYDRSLSVLAKVKARRGDEIYTKSGMMLGLGETEAEVLAGMEDLRRTGCDLLTLGQYLPPSAKHLPLVEYISPQQFVAHACAAQAMGFVHVASGPLVRSSYHADEFSAV
jgi:lipoic acid synthetase